MEGSYEMEASNGSTFGSTVTMQRTSRVSSVALSVRDSKKLFLIAVCVLLVIGIACLVTGSVLIAKAFTEKSVEDGLVATTTESTNGTLVHPTMPSCNESRPSPETDPCTFSEEMIRAGRFYRQMPVLPRSRKNP